MDFGFFTMFQADVVRYIYFNFLKLHLDSSFTVNYNSILFASPPYFLMINSCYASS
jgi:hypothetical protein